MSIRVVIREAVWLVIRDDGNSQEAEESVDSVWRTAHAAQRRSAQLTDALRTRVERHRVGKP